jgi:hypothetical protein
LRLGGTERGWCLSALLLRTRAIASVVITDDIDIECLGEEEIVVIHSTAVCGIAMTEDDCKVSSRTGDIEQSNVRFSFCLNAMDMNSLRIV